MTLKRVGVLSAGKIIGVMYVVLGLFVGGIVSLIALAGASLGGGRDALPGVLGGVAAIVFLPIFYGVLGFLSGVIGAALYNVVARLIGGI
jgi:hypothetical protein